MVNVSDRVWEHWRAVETRFEEPVLILLFATSVSQEEAIDALEEAASAAVADLQTRQPSRGQEEKRSGHWSLAPVPQGVALRIDEEPDLEAMLRRIAEELEARGIEGEFKLYEPAPTVALPEVVDLFELRLRVEGERYHLRYGNYGWRADPDSLWRTVEAGITWCVENGRNQPLSLGVGLITSKLRPADNVGAYMRQALELTRDLGVVRLTSSTSERWFRTIAINASRGRVTLIEGGSALAEDGWAPSVHSLRGVLDSESASIVYGFIKRGSHRPAAEEGYSLAQDWPPRADFRVQALNGEAFEDEYAPDAFGVQLLGSKYADRMPRSANWRSTSIAQDRTILEHVNLKAWFERPFLPHGVMASSLSSEAPPPVLQQGRRDFAPILFSDDVPTAR